jgi:uncharacterized membrane protein
MTDEASIAAYAFAFERAARRLKLAEAGEVAADVRQHIAEARAAGEPWDKIRTKLGAPDALARSYAAELLFGAEAQARDPDRRDGRLHLWTLFGLATGGGLLTLIVTTTLGSISLAFAISAAVMIGLGLPLALGATLPPFVQMSGAPPWVAVALAPVMGLVAWAAFTGLVGYLRWFAGTLRRALPGRA